MEIILINSDIDQKFKTLHSYLWKHYSDSKPNVDHPLWRLYGLYVNCFRATLHNQQFFEGIGTYYLSKATKTLVDSYDQRLNAH